MYCATRLHGAVQCVFVSNFVSPSPALLHLSPPHSASVTGRILPECRGHARWTGGGGVTQSVCFWCSVLTQWSLNYSAGLSFSNRLLLWKKEKSEEGFSSCIHRKIFWYFFVVLGLLVSNRSGVLLLYFSDNRSPPPPPWSSLLLS